MHIYYIACERDDALPPPAGTTLDQLERRTVTCLASSVYAAESIAEAVLRGDWAIISSRREIGAVSADTVVHVAADVRGGARVGTTPTAGPVYRCLIAEVPQAHHLINVADVGQLEAA